MRGRADQPLRHRKARDRAAVLPLIGAILFLPPVAGLFRVDASVRGRLDRLRRELVTRT